MAARFDLLSAFFVLLALISFVEYTIRGQHWCLAAVVLCTILGGLSKEAAFALPLIALVLSLGLQGANRRRRVIGLALMFVTMAALFIYRFVMVGGIGGYKTTSGTAMIMEVSLLRSVKALFYRQWALLFFPVNWSVSLEPWLLPILIAYLAALLYTVWTITLPRASVLTALAVILSAALPVQHLLLIGADLSGARVLYLPVLGLCLLYAVLVQFARTHAAKLLACLPMLVFQVVLLQHNLRIWNSVAILGQHTCQAIGEVVRKTNENVEVAGIPAQLHGVFFVRNALPMCVFFNSGEDPARVIPVVDFVPETNLATRLQWSSDREHLEVVSGDRLDLLPK